VKLLQQNAELAQLQEQLQSSKQQIAQLQNEIHRSKLPNNHPQQHPNGGKQQNSQVQQRYDNKFALAGSDAMHNEDEQFMCNINESNDNGRPPAAGVLPVTYADHIALSAKRRDRKQMQAVFDRHKDVEGKGLSKVALMAALKEVSAPVLSSSDGASEDSVFRRADTNCSNYVDLDECGGALALACCVYSNAAAAGSCWRPTYPTTSKCSWPITAWA
jgi:hypothetical protein